MEYIIDTGIVKTIDWNADGSNRIIQNIINLINTSKYEVAYRRTIGIDSSLLHNPADDVIAKITAEIIDTINNYEKRVTVKSVKFNGIDENGTISFKVVIDI